MFLGFEKDYIVYETLSSCGSFSKWNTKTEILQYKKLLKTIKKNNY